MAPPKRPNWTPHLTSSERSPKASVSKAAIEPPMLPPPPYSTGKPSVVWPASASVRVQPSTFSRYSSVPIPAPTAANSGSASIPRPRSRISP